MSTLHPEQIKVINELRRARGTEREKLDKIIFAVTGGTLSLSVTLLSNSSQTLTGKNLLGIAWIFLLLGMITILLAYTFAIVNFEHCEKGIKKQSFSSQEEMESNWWRTASEAMNWLSLLLLVMGILFFAWFGWLNI